MNLPFNIARRYLFAKKSQNIINIISMISAIGVFTGTVALVVVLSVFNGLHGFVGSLFGSFDAELQIEPLQGKVFDATDSLLMIVRNTEGVEHVSAIVRDNGLLKYSKRQMPAVILGVDSSYHNVTGIDTIMIDGAFRMRTANGDGRCVLGFILADQLGARSSFLTPLVIYAPKRKGQINMAMPERSFNTKYLSVAGTFAVKQVEYDSNYVIVDIEVARSLFGYLPSQVTALNVKLSKGANVNLLKKTLTEIWDGNVAVKDRIEQHESFFKMMKVEKLMAFLILTFIIVIAAFNIIGSISMLIFEKRESIFTLKSMGACQSLVTKIFLFEGCLISLSGVALGVVVGIALVLVQQHFGVIGFGTTDAYIIDAYPVKLEFVDVLVSFVTVSIVGVLSSWYPVHVIVGKYYNSEKS